MRQALQSRVHEASISKVSQPGKSSSRLRSVLQLLLLLIRLSLVGAPILMMTLISSLAVPGAVNGILAAAYKVKLIFFLAVIAGSLQFMGQVEEAPILTGLPHLSNDDGVLCDV